MPFMCLLKFTLLHMLKFLSIAINQWLLVVAVHIVLFLQISLKFWMIFFSSREVTGKISIIRLSFLTIFWSKLALVFLFWRGQMNFTIKRNMKWSKALYLVLVFHQDAILCINSISVCICSLLSTVSQIC